MVGCYDAIYYLRSDREWPVEDRLRLTVIEPSRRLSLRSVWAEYREYSTLLRYLTLRDLQLRFQNRALGVLWVTLLPVLPAAIFAAVFARVLQPATGGVPYSLFALAGFVPWTFFSTSVSTASMTFVWNANLLNKVYFPRGILPASAMLASCVELLAGCALLCGWSWWKGYPPHVAWLWLPLYLAYVAVVAFVISLGLATANALNRNVKFAIPFLMQVWIYATPVVYPTSMVPVRSRWLLGLNPLTAAMDGMRAAMFGSPVDRDVALMSVGSAVVLACVAMVLFRRFESSLAERA